MTPQNIATTVARHHAMTAALARMTAALAATPKARATAKTPTVATANTTGAILTTATPTATPTGGRKSTADASRQSYHWQREYPLALALALTACIFPCACSTCPSADVNGVFKSQAAPKDVAR